jgi:hypothetical protein
MRYNVKRSADQRFDSKWIPEPNSGCWIWIAHVDHKGYGKFSIGYENMMAHRFSFTRVNGCIPDGMLLDHICRVRSCVNPDHLRVVTPRENTTKNSLGPTARNAAKTHCNNGHEFTPENTHTFYVNGFLCRRCRECARQADLRYRKSGRRAFIALHAQGE